MTLKASRMRKSSVVPLEVVMVVAENLRQNLKYWCSMEGSHRQGGCRACPILGWLALYIWSLENHRVLRVNSFCWEYRTKSLDDPCQRTRIYQSETFLLSKRRDGTVTISIVPPECSAKRLDVDLHQKVLLDEGELMIEFPTEYRIKSQLSHLMNSQDKLSEGKI